MPLIDIEILPPPRKNQGFINLGNLKTMYFESRQNYLLQADVL